MQMQSQLEQTKSQLKMMEQEAEVKYKKELMEMEFQMNMKLRELDATAKTNAENMKEDRKDERTKIQASQQSEMIDQRNNDKAPKNFESTGNDTLGGDFNLGQFDPN